MPYASEEQWCRSPAGVAILAYLSDPSRSIKPNDIANATGYAPGAVVSIMSRLSRHGYLKKQFLLTDSGQALLSK